jgi:hypothetical protein
MQRALSALADACRKGEWRTVMKDFLNPKSMITPGIAGASMMFLVNGLLLPFPEITPFARYLALALSALFSALVVFQDSTISRLERILYWVINALIIFVVGFGTNSLGQSTSSSAAAKKTSQFFAVISSAYAQKPAATSSDAGVAAKVPPATDEAAKALQVEVDKLRSENADLKEKAAQTSKDHQQTSFFKKW